MERDELLRLQREMGMSNADMALRVLKIPKSTYQRYYDGTATIPVNLAVKVKAAHEKDRLWTKGFIERLGRELDSQFPFGIKSDFIEMM